MHILSYIFHFKGHNTKTVKKDENKDEQDKGNVHKTPKLQQQGTQKAPSP
jgi:hypothetical protein